MTLVKLSSKELPRLEWLIASASDVKQLRRAQALLWLAEGDHVEEVADRLRVDRRTIYNWVTRFYQRTHLTPELRLSDGARQGRPATAQGIIDPIIDAVIEDDPRDYGYRSTIWTAPLLQHYLAERYRIEVCTKSISLAITRLRIAWKRPRHRLALRSPTWRQAKGGSNAGFSAKSGRSS
jgi:transposase